MKLTVSKFIDEILDNYNSTIILFDINKNNIIYQGRAENIPQCLLERHTDKVEVNKNSILLRIV